MDFELWHFPHSSDLKRATAEPLGQCADGMVDKSHLPKEGLQVKKKGLQLLVGQFVTATNSFSVPHISSALFDALLLALS